MGQIAAFSVTAVWDTMTQAPYFVQPTIRSYNILIKSLANQSDTPQLITKMHEGLELYYQSLRKAHQSWSQLATAMAHPPEVPETDAVGLKHLRQQWEADNLARSRNLLWVKRWLRLALASFGEWSRVDSVTQHFARTLPRLVWDWKTFAPTVVRYEMPTGFVEFRIRSADEILESGKVQRRIWAEQQRVRGTAPMFVGDRWLDQTRA